jgi:hypothetical protein
MRTEFELMASFIFFAILMINLSSLREDLKRIEKKLDVLIKGKIQTETLPKFRCD